MGRTFRLGLFIVGTLLVLGAGVFLIGSKQLRFRRRTRSSPSFPTWPACRRALTCAWGEFTRAQLSHRFAQTT